MFTKEERQDIYDLSDDFTAGQIASRIGAERNAVYACLRSMDVYPLTEADLAKNKLYKEAALYSREEMFKRLDVSKFTFDKYVQECEVKFKEEIKAANPTVRESFNDIRILAELMEGVKETYGKVERPHFKDKYTQSHSPFGLADQVKEIKIEIA